MSAAAVADSPDLEALFDSVVAANAAAAHTPAVSKPAVGDSPDLEALFDSVVAARKKVPAALSPVRPQAAADSPDLEALFDSVAAAARVETAATEGLKDDGVEVITRIGKLTRSLHDGLRELGIDKTLASAAGEIPDTCDRLSYVANMTEQAAQKALNATELATPIQETLAKGACGLSERWDALFKADPGVEAFRQLVTDTRGYLAQIPERARETQAHLTEIMMAQDFQDLTGQVIKRITEVVRQLESQLLTLLVDNAPPEKAQEAGQLLNGPVIKAAGRNDVVSSQKQVDDLLESLGF